MRLIGENLSCRRGGRLVLESLSFTVSGSEVLAVTGPNGAGKSTLLRLIAGLLNAEAGSLRLEEAPGSGEIARLCHYLGHQDAIKAGWTVAADLSFWTRYWGGRGRPAAALEAVGLLGLATVPAGALSAGQRRRLALARLVAVRRPVWLLDEPTSALDAAGEAMLGRLIDDHVGRGGLIVASTHQALPRVADRALMLRVPA